MGRKVKKNHPPNAAEIHGLIDGLSEKHVLKRSPRSYVDGFVAAALHVYAGTKLRKVLQDKFFVPDDSHYSDDAYFQSASELSVANHVKHKPVAHFTVEKRVDPANKKDVDVYFHLGATRVSVEVKCPFEEKPASSGDITLLTAGRIPNHREKYEELKGLFESGNQHTKLILGKNREYRMRDCLVSANAKFSSESGVDDLNVLFLSCGYFYRMNEWYHCLHGGQGLFTSNSFCPEARCPNVDFVILSNLKYRHEYAREHPAWTLDDVLLLPIINPHGRSSCTSAAIKEGLSVFHHYRREFASFGGGQLIVDEHSEVKADIEEMLKVNRFVGIHLTAEERSRFFPVSLRG